MDARIWKTANRFRFAIFVRVTNDNSTTHFSQGFTRLLVFESGVLMLARGLVEKNGTYSNQSSPLFDCLFKVVAHSHR